MSCIVLDIEPADKNVFQVLGVFLMAKFMDTHFVFQKSTNRQSKHFGVQEKCTELCATLGI